MIKFNTKAEVEKFLESSGMTAHSDGQWYSMARGYILGHREYAAPDYQPRLYSDGWGIHAKYYHYRGSLSVPEDGRVDVADCLNPDGSLLHPDQIAY